MAVVVAGERIQDVVPVSDLEFDARHAEVIEASGLFAVPGLIDTHVHLATEAHRAWAEARLRRFLYSGVTAVRDMAGDARMLADLARAARTGEIPAPDIYYAALMAGPSFFVDPRAAAAAQGAKPGEVPWMQAITSATDLPLAVATARGTSATAIKIYANLPGTLVQKITAEAHRQRMPVWAHGAVYPATPQEVIEAGVDVVSHVCTLANHVTTPMRQSYGDRLPVDYAAAVSDVEGRMTALFGMMRARGTILDATAFLSEERDRRARARAESQPGGRSVPPRRDCTGEHAARLIAKAYREGVPISAGTDTFGSWQQRFPTLHDELETLADRVGMSNSDVIRAATAIAARALGQAHELGTIEPGKLANLVFVSKNPLEDVSNLRSVEFTVKRGVIYRRADYVPISEDELPARRPGANSPASSQGAGK